MPRTRKESVKLINEADFQRKLDNIHYLAKEAQEANPTQRKES